MKKRLISTLLTLCMVLTLLPGTARAAEASGSCGDNVTWSYENGVLTIQGTGPMTGKPEAGLYSGNPGPWSDYSQDIRTVRILEGVTTIGGYLFAFCPNLTTVEIPTSVTVIHYNAFERSGLTDMYYGGTEKQWYQQVVVEHSNDPLNLAFWHFKEDSSAPRPSFDPNAPYAPSYTVSSPVTSHNIDGQNYNVQGPVITSYLFENRDGGLTRVEYISGRVVVEDYSRGFVFQGGLTIPMELDLWGGFYAGEDYNFFIFGQNNVEENDNKEVIRVVKYSKNWERLGQSSLYGANTSVPFGFGSLRCAEYDGELYIRTCHLMYADKGGTNHQANLTLAIRESDMKLLDSYYDVMNTSVGYVSHSFNQFVLVDQQNRIVTLDHGDALPRSAVLMVYDTKAGQGKFSGTVTSVDVYGFPRDFNIDNNYTGASLGGLAETSGGYVVAFNYDGTGSGMRPGERCVYLVYLRKDSYSTVMNMLSGVGTMTPVLVSTGLSGGYVLWNSTDKTGLYGTDDLYYVTYSSDGSVGTAQTATARLSGCQPILYNGKATWYTTDNSLPVFYQLDKNGVTAHGKTGGNNSKPESDKTDGNTTSGVSEDGLTWSLKDGVLTIQGTGPMKDYDFDENQFAVLTMPWFDHLQEIRSVIIGNGVTSIGECAFAYCRNLTDITIPDTVTSIGTWSFHDCDNLTSVTIPEGVTTIPGSTFYNTDSLVSVTLPKSLTSVGRCGFKFSGKNTDVYYAGTRSEWDQIQIEDENWGLFYATIHCAPDEPQPTEEPTPTQEPQPAETPAPTPGDALAISFPQTVLVDGKAVTFYAYSLVDENGGITNYVKLRDVAAAVTGTKAQFEVGWDGSINLEPGKPYTVVGGELLQTFEGDKPYVVGDSPVNVNGSPAKLDAITLWDDKGGNYNYFKLRALGSALGFNVGWSAEKGIFIETDKPYTDAD